MRRVHLLLPALTAGGCLFAPAPPGAGDDGGVTPDAAPLARCACTDDPDAALTVTAVVPSPTSPGTDRLVRGGWCGGELALRIHVAVDGTLPLRCPTETIPLTDVLPDERGTARIQALAAWDYAGGSVGIVLERANGTELRTIDLADGSAARVAMLPRIAGDTVFLAHGPLLQRALIAGTGEVVLVGIATPPNVAKPDPQAQVTIATEWSDTAERQWALTGPGGDLLAPGTLPAGVELQPRPPPWLCIGQCALVGHASFQERGMAERVQAFAVESTTGGDAFTTIWRGGVPVPARGVLARPSSARIVDVAVALTADGATWIATLGDGGDVTMAPLTFEDSRIEAPPLAGALDPDVTAPARIVMGRFGEARPRAYVLAARPGAPGRTEACVEVDGDVLRDCGR